MWYTNYTLIVGEPTVAPQMMIMIMKMVMIMIMTGDCLIYHDNCSDRSKLYVVHKLHSHCG